MKYLSQQTTILCGDNFHIEILHQSFQISYIGVVVGLQEDLLIRHFPGVLKKVGYGLNIQIQCPFKIELFFKIN